jgi:hypothetical protein
MQNWTVFQLVTTWVNIYDKPIKSSPILFVHLNYWILCCANLEAKSSEFYSV